MKKIILFILLFITFQVKSQFKSENGYYGPNKDTIRVFLVFAEAIDDSNYFRVDTSNWRPGQLPINPGKYFDAHFDPNNIQGYMTKYFYEASFKKYIDLGDYYPYIVKVKFSEPRYAKSVTSHNSIKRVVKKRVVKI